MQKLSHFAKKKFVLKFVFIITMNFILTFGMNNYSYSADKKKETAKSSKSAVKSEKKTETKKAKESDGKKSSSKGSSVKAAGNKNTEKKPDGKKETGVKTAKTNTNTKNEKNKNASKEKNLRSEKVPPITLPSNGSNEITINSKRFNMAGGITLESGSKLENIKKLASELKQSYDETQKKKPKKVNKYAVKLPQSYHEIDMPTASAIMDRVKLKSLGMFKTLYLPHIKTGKLKKGAPAKKNKDEIDGRTKMALFIVGNFINEVIEKYDTGYLSKSHKDFPRWIDEGSQLLAYGSLYSGKKNKSEKSGHTAKSREKNGIIPYTVAKKLLRSLIERESSSVQMSAGRVNISINMSTYPNDGSYVIGFMQESVNDFARGVNLFDPEVNIKYTCKKLHKYLVKYGGNIDKMLRAYNAGENNMDCNQAHTYSSKVMSAMNKY